jgi:hypothetical protein
MVNRGREIDVHDTQHVEFTLHQKFCKLLCTYTTNEVVICSGLKLSSVMISKLLQMNHY